MSSKKKFKEEAKKKFQTVVKKETKDAKKDNKDAKKDNKDVKRETKRSQKDAKKESKKEAKDVKQQKPTFVTHKPEIIINPADDEEVETPVTKRPSLMKSNSISGGDLGRFPSEEDVNSRRSFYDSMPRMKRRSMYHSEMELPRIDEDDREGNRRSVRRTLSRRVSNLLRVTTDKLMGRSADNLSKSRSMQSLADPNYPDDFVPLTRSASVMLPKGYGSSLYSSAKDTSEPSLNTVVNDEESNVKHRSLQRPKGNSLLRRSSSSFSSLFRPSKKDQQAQEEVEEVTVNRNKKPKPIRPQSMVCDTTILEEPSNDLMLRSRSLNNLDSLMSKSRRFGDRDLEGSLASIGRISNMTHSSSSPDLTAYKRQEKLYYTPGPTKGKSVFVRRRDRKLKHSFSQGSPEEFFTLRLPPNFDHSKLMDKKLLKNHRILNSFVFIPAVGNTSLRNAVKASLGNKVDFENSVFTLEGVKGVLDIDRTDVGRLAEKTVHLVTTDKKGKKVVGKKSFQENKGSSKTKFFSRSTEENTGRPKSSSASEKPHGISQKFNQLFFGNKTDSAKMEMLEAKLNEFSATGEIPLADNWEMVKLSRDSWDALIQLQDTKVDHLFGLKPNEGDEESEVMKSIIEIFSELNGQELNRQRVILELITTEASYIRHIRTAVELFYSTAYALQNEGIMTEVDYDKLFSNITEILNVNLTYWSKSLYPMLADALSRKDRFNTQLLLEGVENFEECFKPYEIFVYEQKKTLQYSKQLMETSAIYTGYLAWCESHKECNRLKLADILVKPMQRLTKYSLLFDSIYKQTELEPEKGTLEKMVRIVKSYITSVNLGISYKEDCEATDKIIRSIDGYDVFDIRDEDLDPNVKKHLNLNLNGPIPGCNPHHRRIIILQGDVKMRDNHDARLEVRAFLLTDMLVICTQSKKKKPEEEPTYRIIRHKFMVDRLKVYPQTQMKDGKEEITSLLFVYVDETGTAVNYFTFTEINGKEITTNPTLKSWEFAINEAKTTVDMARLYYREPGKCPIDFDTDSMSDTDTDRKGLFRVQDVNQPDKLKKLVRKAAQKRVYTMILGASISSGEQFNYEGSLVDNISVNNRNTWRGGAKGRSRDSSRGSRLSSLQQSYSGSYDMNESKDGPTKILGSADTSMDRHTISMSSDEYIPNTNYADGLDVESNQKHMLRPRSPSQRQQVRPTFHATPNTLSVQQPLQSMMLGQSMPDLASAEIAIPTASLKRGNAIFKTPLLKTKHISRDSSPANLQITSKYDKLPVKVSSLSPYSFEGPCNTSSLETFNIHVKGNYLRLPSMSQSNTDGQKSQQNSPDVEKDISK